MPHLPLSNSEYITDVVIIRYRKDRKLSYNRKRNNHNLIYSRSVFRRHDKTYIKNSSFTIWFYKNIFMYKHSLIDLKINDGWSRRKKSMRCSVRCQSLACGCFSNMTQFLIRIAIFSTDYVFLFTVWDRKQVFFFLLNK
jgi:hypothetical protein